MTRNKTLAMAIALFAVITAGAQTLPYQNPKLSAEERAEDLLGRLTLDQKISLMRNGSPAIDSLGIPAWDWWSEALHGVGRNGTSTTFPSCIGMAASFDDGLIEQVFTAVSDEARAKNTQMRREGQKVGRYQCLSFWTPTINIFRDPRWGRGQESYGEDPFMNARMGLRVVRGLQGPADAKYRKLLACAKHFAVHSGPEKLRHQMNIESLPARDLWETYLPAFKALVKEGGVEEVMCAYQRFEGDPCCGSNRLLQQILRDEWGFKGLVVSDCGAIGDFWQEGRHGVSADQAAASAKAVLAGTDVECGSHYGSLAEAVKRGDISEEQINVSVKRLLTGRFKLGNFDPDSIVPWTNIPASVVSSKKHLQLARQMGREQMVLLKNNGVLPLNSSYFTVPTPLPTEKTKKPKMPISTKLMVMGPNAADSTMLWGIYFGKPVHTVTPLEGIQSKVGPVNYLTACSITSMTVKDLVVGGQTETADGSTTLQMVEKGKKTYAIKDILDAASGAETVIFVGGISPNLEREQARVQEPGFDGGDRTSIELPQVQRDILRALHEAGKKVVFVCCSGSAMALVPEMETCDAIVEAWYAGEQGGHALADVLFGDYNFSGKLPVTFYKDDTQLPPFDDYSMKGRTYRYFKGEPLFPFGYGLSYTTFEVGKARAFRQGSTYKLFVPVTNTGNCEGTEVLQVYVRRPADINGPQKSLRDYCRVSLKPGEQQTITINVPRERFEVWDEKTSTMRVLPGVYEVMVGTSSDQKDLQTLTVKVE